MNLYFYLAEVTSLSELMMMLKQFEFFARKLIKNKLAIRMQIE